MSKQRIKLVSGGVVTLNLLGKSMTRKEDMASFELVLCKRNKQGYKTDRKSSVYCGDNPAAVEATFLKGMSKKEKKKDLYEVR